MVSLREADILLKGCKVCDVREEAVREGHDILVVVFSLVVVWSLGQMVSFVHDAQLVFYSYIIVHHL